MLITEMLCSDNMESGKECPMTFNRGGMSKKNCWEFRNCGRESAGLGDSPCPACTCKDLDGANGGRNAGRACWVAAGSLNDDEQSGQHPHTQKHCWMCDFFNAVREEETSSTAGFSFTRPAMEQAGRKEAPMKDDAQEFKELQLVIKKELENVSLDVFGSHAEEFAAPLNPDRQVLALQYHEADVRDHQARNGQKGRPHS